LFISLLQTRLPAAILLIVMKLTLVGLSFKTTPLELRERLHLSTDQTPIFLQSLRIIAEEAFVISTCNRFEVLLAGGPNDAFERTVGAISDHFKISADEFRGCLYHHTGSQAVEHLFRVACSLDSMIVGEAQILGQLKQFFRIAQQFNTIGPYLHALIERAIMIAKKIRSETGIASCSVSIPSVAVELACRIFGDIQAKTALVIGAGKMGLLALRQLKARGVQQILLTNRTFSKAEELANEIGGRAFPFEFLEKHLPQADIVIGSTGSREPVINKSDVHQALGRRKNKPMFFMDIALPRDLDPSINDLPNVYLYDLDDLKMVSEKNRSGRQSEAKQAEEIVLQETELFWSKLQALDTNPMIRSIRDSVTEVCRQELNMTLPKMGSITQEQQQKIEMLVCRLSDKILQNPFSQMRQLAAQPGNLEKIDFIGKLFR
jgi:glutamyl-tRNA reductase